MSTIIKYKGNTVAVADNDTRTLLTNGKWLENNIEITSQTPTTTTIAVVDTVDPAGGTVREITTGTAISDEVTYTTVNYNNATIASFHSDTTKSLRTGGTFAESDFEVVSDEPDTMSYEVTDTLDVKEGTIRDIEVTSMSNRFFDLSYPNGNVITTVSEVCDYIAYGRTGIKNLYAPNLKKTNSNGFRYCSSLESLYLPNCTYISEFSLANNSSLKYVYAPNCSILGQSAFNSYCLIESLVLPSFNTGYTGCLSGMSNLKCLDVGNSATRVTEGFFRALIFNGDAILDTMVLRSPNVISLNSGLLSSTPFAEGGSGGTIYVPSALIDSYKTATNWSVYDSYGTITWLPIEGSEYENKYVDGTTFEEYENIQPPFEDMKNADWFFDYKLYPNGKVTTNITDIPGRALVNRKAISEFYSDTLKTMNGGYVFTGSSLKIAVLPNLTTAYSDYYYDSCYNLTTVDIGKSCPHAGGRYYTFNGDYNFTTLILRRTADPAILGNINAFNGTPFAQGGSGGIVYVPSALIESYKTTTNWSILFGYGTVTFLPIEGSQYEHYYANGMAIEEE